MSPIASMLRAKCRVLVFFTVTLSVGLFASYGVAAGKEVRFKDTPLEFAPGAKLIVSGIKGSVRLTALQSGKPGLLKGKKTLSDKPAQGAAERFEALGFQVRREGDNVIIEVKGPELGTDPKGYWGAGAPELQLEIEAPAVPVEIAWREGQILAQGWKSPVAVTLVEGLVKLSSGEGFLRAQLQKGDIKIDDHRGRLDLDTYGAKVQVAKVEGDVSLSSFAGESAISQVRGSVNVRAGTGSVAVAKTTGALDFDLKRASLNVSEFDGAVHGETADGAVTVQILDDADVNIQSQRANVSVKLPAGSGAALRLKSEEGGITAPESITVAKAAEMRVASGRLPGAGPKGSIVISTQSGAIRVR